MAARRSRPDEATQGRPGRRGAAQLAPAPAPVPAPAPAPADADTPPGRAARSHSRRRLRLPGEAARRVAEYWRRSGGRRSMPHRLRRRARRRACRGIAAAAPGPAHERPLPGDARPNGLRAPIGANAIARAAWKINSYDRMSRRKAAPAGARHGDGTGRAARSRISTRARRRAALAGGRRAPHRAAGRRS
ncbi:hypothetical protein C7S16_4620 [Burkholderia thailandensis]|uniref:Uncharacterized protein n=1 Tax=Burkholderia thailandensis TaxID=57975 RepID=A0AAW9CQR1_BURTH|nr:hypothetical protein [Burkholderia thailandensis]MDW9251132.1 hypothetical protein [Burkholderia thailandensis]